MLARRCIRNRNGTLTAFLRRTSTTSAGSSKTSSTRGGSNSSMYRRMFPVIVASSVAGFILGRQSVPSEEEEGDHLHLPNGLPRTCCDEPELTEKQQQLLKILKRIVGKANVLDGRQETTETSPFLKGARLGKGSALCIVKPDKLKQLVEIVRAVVEADCCVLVQGQNTGLTGGSVPRNQAGGRPTVIVSMKGLDTIFPIDGGERVVCLAGAGLATLQHFVQEQFPDRESHSILGSTFLNPTTAAGVAFGSGGTQMRKGPAFTERALYLKVVADKFGKSTVLVVNTLGVEGLDSEEGEFESHLRHDGVIRVLDTYTSAVKAGLSNKMKKSNDTHGKKPASDTQYKTRLCQHGKEVNRYNADTRGCDCNRSEGKVLILASVHDTFPKPAKSKTFWISFDSFETALKFRRQVCLDNPNDLPVSMEYMDRDSFDVIDSSGRVLGNTIKAVGTSSPLVRSLWNFKIWIEALNVRGASLIGDKILYWLNPLMPEILPATIMKMGKEKNHHVAMTVGDFDGSLDRFMERLGEFQKQKGSGISVHECQSQSEENSLTAFRFVAAPAFRTYCVGNGVQGFSVDYALPRDGGEAPPLQSETPLKRMRYSHFGCNVVHEDVAFPAGVDVESVKYTLKKSVEHECRGKLPAEHGHGTEYHAPESTQKRWMQMDPLNVMNPGVGGLPSTYRYRTN